MAHLARPGLLPAAPRLGCLLKACVESAGVGQVQVGGRGGMNSYGPTFLAALLLWNLEDVLKKDFAELA